MIVHNVIQGTPEWHMLRLGIPTASEFHQIVTPKTLQLSKQSVSYMHWLLAEWYTGAPLENPETEWMIRGTEMEPKAVKSYEFECDRETETVGFITTDDGRAGASPDRLVGNRGLLEIKCPAPATHIGYMVSSGVDEKYRIQLQGQLWVAERDWVDIQSYYPGLPTVIIRIGRDDKTIRLIADAVLAFCDVLDAARAQLSQSYGPPRRTAPQVKVEDPLGITDEDLQAIFNDADRQKGGAA